MLYNASTGQTAVWYMNDNVLVSGEFGPTLPPGWIMAGVADFNGDGKLDYLLLMRAQANPRSGICLGLHLRRRLWSNSCRWLDH